MAGQVRASGVGAASAGAQPSAQKTNAVPTIADMESSQQPPPDSSGSPPAPPGRSSPRLGLAQTTLMGASKGGGSCPAGGALDEAVAKQQDLLAEFEKVADELNRILANLEGSTLVKRLKAASRLQLTVAGRLSDQVTHAFGVPASAVKEPQGKVFAELASREARSSSVVSTIMDDMSSYFERRRLVKFRDVLDDMRKRDVVGNLRQLGEDLRKESALAIAQCEYWSDHLDRWAEDLVDPSRSGC
jgi:pentatricopeptide repeat protein